MTVSEEKRFRVSPIIRQRSKELRQPLTPAEHNLWHVLRNRNLGGYKFRRQHPIGRFIVDFYCAENRLVIEIDGDIHSQQLDYDLARTEWLQHQGYTVLRYQNQHVLQNLDEVTQNIIQFCLNGIE